MWVVTGLFTLGLSFLPRKGRLGVWLAVGWVALILYRQPPVAAEPAQPSASQAARPAAQPVRPMPKTEATHSAGEDAYRYDRLNYKIVPASTPLINADVIEQKDASFSDSWVIADIQRYPANYSFKPEDLTALRKAGISERVIGAMIEKQKSQDGCTAASEAVILRRRAFVKSDPQFSWKSRYDSATGRCYVSENFGTLSSDDEAGTSLYDASSGKVLAVADRTIRGLEYGIVVPDGVHENELFYSDENEGHAAFLKANAFIQDRTGHQIGSNDDGNLRGAAGGPATTPAPAGTPPPATPPPTAAPPRGGTSADPLGDYLKKRGVQ
jgi:hypothetical protein